MPQANASIGQVLETQAAVATHVGSALYGRLLEGLLADYQAGGLTAELLEGTSERPGNDAIHLRLLATGHRLALAGEAPSLAQYYASCGGTWNGENVAQPFLAVAALHRPLFDKGMRRNVQTNEVGRAPVLASAFALIARRHIPDIDILEIGSSAGLLSRWDQYRYDTGASQLGDAASPLQFSAGWWTDPSPSLAGSVRVVRRRASDIHPIDVTSNDGRLTMLSFVWPDQVDRIARLRAALEIAQQFPLAIDRSDAGDWLTEQLAPSLRADAATVVFHSIVWQYLPPQTRDRVRAAIFDAGSRASQSAPLAWLRMEPASAAFANVRLTTWPGGTDEVLAEVGFHGADIRWLVPD